VNFIFFTGIRIHRKVLSESTLYWSANNYNQKNILTPLPGGIQAKRIEISLVVGCILVGSFSAYLPQPWGRGTGVSRGKCYCAGITFVSVHQE